MKMKFYYGMNNDAYFELERSDFEILDHCIRILDILYDEEKYIVFQDFVDACPVATNVESVIKSILTEEQFKLYQSAPLF